MAQLDKKIAIVGGTGKEGKGLAYRWAKAGLPVIIGSRSEEKAVQAAAEVNNRLAVHLVSGMQNHEAVSQADLIVLTIPFAFHREILLELKNVLQGKILVDVTVPLVPPKITRVQMPPEGSAAQQAQAILGEDVMVVAAFQNISYEHLMDDDEIQCDVIVCGGNKEARQQVLSLVSLAGMIGWDGGVIENSVVVEGLTSILIGLNKQYGVQSAGIKIVGIPRTNSQ
ncbi:MAG TPA: NADPH-dependent F420 reductase [Anaerolineaceae bacterium]